MTNHPQIIRHKRSPHTTHPQYVIAPRADKPNPNSDAITAQANSAPVESVSPSKPESGILTLR